jgi:hypothetical protein
VKFEAESASSESLYYRAEALASHLDANLAGQDSGKLEIHCSCSSRGPAYMERRRTPQHS